MSSDTEIARKAVRNAAYEALDRLLASDDAQTISVAWMDLSRAVHASVVGHVATSEAGDTQRLPPPSVRTL